MGLSEALSAIVITKILVYTLSFGFKFNALAAGLLAVFCAALDEDELVHVLSPLDEEAQVQAVEEPALAHKLK